MNIDISIPSVIIAHVLLSCQVVVDSNTFKILMWYLHIWYQLFMYGVQMKVHNVIRLLANESAKCFCV